MAEEIKSKTLQGKPLADMTYEEQRLRVIASTTSYGDLNVDRARSEMVFQLARIGDMLERVNAKLQRLVDKS